MKDYVAEVRKIKQTENERLTQQEKEREARRKKDDKYLLKGKRLLNEAFSQLHGRYGLTIEYKEKAKGWETCITVRKDGNHYASVCLIIHKEEGRHYYEGYGYENFDGLKCIIQYESKYLKEKSHQDENLQALVDRVMMDFISDLGVV